MPRAAVSGTAVSPGLAIGPVHVVRTRDDDVPVWTVGSSEVPGEIGRLAAALNQAAERLTERQQRVALTTSDKDAEIFAVHRMILQDPGAMREVETAIREERINAEAAVKLLIDRLGDRMRALDGDSVRAYGSDVSDPWRLVLEMLLERDREEITHSSTRVVLAAAELTPKAVTFLERDRVLAVVAETGGRFSHGAVLARSLGVPCVVGLPNLLARLEQGMTVAVDGDRGLVQLRPEPTELTMLLEKKRSQEGRRQALRQESSEKARTPDGTKLDVQVNIESVRDLETFDVSHTDGVGLLRTEFLYLERNEFPSEEEQYRMYRRVLERMEGRAATFRLLDIGGDKPLPYFKTPPEPNPALGWRGIRITLQWRDLLRVQLRAFLRASTAGRLRILLPMVTSLEEVREIHETFREIRTELAHQGYPTASDVPVGAMVEIPSMLFALGALASEVNFVSVGTNDLVQYLLAVDRDNPWVSDLYDPQHPSVVRALAEIARSSSAAGIPASVCGDLAADPASTILLLGMGYDGVSVAPQFIPEIKYAVRRTPLSAARDYVRDALAAETAADVREVLDRIRENVYGDHAAGRGA